MLFLGIESSTPIISAAVGDESGILGEVSVKAEQAHMRLLLPLIDTLLNKLQLEIKEIDAFAAGVGPGSFTSLRIGLATCKSLAHASGKPLYGVPTLDVLAAALEGRPGLICPILQARRQEVYTAFYVNSPKGIKRLSSYLALDPEKMAARLEKELQTEITFTGEGAGYYWNILQGKLGKKASLADPALIWPRAGLVISLGKKQASIDTGDPGSVQAIYVRPPGIKGK